MNKEKKLMFEDLGRATLRGVRKCPECGTFNGTRGSCCKNKSCRHIFKLSKREAPAVRIMSRTKFQIFSVKQNDSTRDDRCFVEVPLLDGIETFDDPAEIATITHSAAKCHAPECRRPLDDISTLITLNINPCFHISYISNCITEAKPLILKNAILNTMQFNDSIKQKIWALITRSNDSLVQRVTRNTMVVKCVPDVQHPLGFLHFSIYEPAKKSRNFRILCECQTGQAKAMFPGQKQMCVHFYACMFAFTCDKKLFDEFHPLIVASAKTDSSSDLYLLKLFDTTELQESSASPSKKVKTNTDAESSNKVDIQTSNKKPIIDETSIRITFENWLGSVTERINQTMHYQFNGRPGELVFHVPQAFFNCLQQRISRGSKKKRLPNSTVHFVRKNALPVGAFTRYTWEITNILHVKQIFETEEVPLQVTQRFIQNRDGTYEAHELAHPEMQDLASQFKKTNSNPLIKPLELKTFLKVGIMSLEQKIPTPFIIEWIPDILPKTHVGEMRIKFEYGHQRNGLVEKRNISQLVQ